MKLATLKDGSRDGQLVVVSRDLGTAHYATGIASRLQQVLDDWGFMSPQLQDLYVRLNQGRATHAFPFNPAQCMAPLPRAYAWAEGTAYAPPEAMEPPDPTTGQNAARAKTPRLRYGNGSHFLGPRDDLIAPDVGLDIDFNAGIAALTGDVPMGASPEQALDGIRLLMLVNALRLCAPSDGTNPPGLAPCQSHAATAFGPVAVTLDELGPAWREGRVHLALHCNLNGRTFGRCDAGPDMRVHFGQLIAHLAQRQPVRAGTVVGSGPVSNPGADKSGTPAWPHGHACIAEKREVERRDSGQPTSAFLQPGDHLRIDLKGLDGHSVFGAIEQRLLRPGGTPPAEPSPAEDHPAPVASGEAS